MGHIGAVETDRAAVGRHQSERCLQHHRLARSRAAEHDQRTPARDIDINAAQNMIVAKGFDDTFELQQRRAHRPISVNTVDIT